jgi:hypothetical protein
MKTQEELRNYLMGKMRSGEISNFTRFFTAFVFGGGSSISESELLNYFEYLFKMAVEAHRDDLALALLNKIRDSYHDIEEKLEMMKKETRHLGNARKRADDKFFEFIVDIYPTIAWKKHSGLDGFTPDMQKTRFQILEYAAQRWEQMVCSES